MPAINVIAETKLSRSIRARQIESMFDVPAAEKCKLEWYGDLPIEDGDWNIGLIVGPSGSGKSTIARETFKDNYHIDFEWKSDSVIDDFDKGLSIDQISRMCGAVGFNTIPAWLRPYSVLSTGERFRVDCARRLLELEDPIIIDEFTSVVDRQVAKIASHAIQKAVRKTNKKLIAISCHYDIIDWLLPDWTLEPATMEYVARGSLQQRPEIKAEVRRTAYEAWKIFAPYHYLTADLHKAARCFCAFVDGFPVSFVGILRRPNFHIKGRDIMGVSRFVTLPDWQGIGVGIKLVEFVASAYHGTGWRVRIYPAHPAIIQAAARRPQWKLIKKPGYVQKVNAENARKRKFKSMRTASRPCAVFEYCGEKMDRPLAQKLIEGAPA